MQNFSIYQKVVLKMEEKQQRERVTSL